MKKKLALILVPFLLSACDTVKGNEESPANKPKRPEGFEQTAQVEDSRKGEKITSEEATNVISDITKKSPMMKDTTDPEAFIEDASEFSYYFKNKMDDSVELVSHVNYSQEKQFFSQQIFEKVIDETGIYTLAVSNYEYILNNQYVVAIFDSFGLSEVDYLPVEDYTRTAIFAYLSDMILNIANCAKDALSQIESYSGMSGAMSGGQGMTLEYYSSGPGNLYICMSMESLGIYVEELFENYWITYEYMYTDLTKLMGGSQIEMPYKHMMTELNIKFGEADINYPNI